MTYNMKAWLTACVGIAALLAGGCEQAGNSTEDAANSQAAAETTIKAPLFENIGEHHHPITTDSELAQRYFDQGLMFAYGFNHAEAKRSFLAAAEADPGCAMCWWGAAWVLGPNINVAMDPEKAPEAWEYLQRAASVFDDETAREQHYVSALQERYGPEPLEDRSPRDAAFARVTGRLAELHPDDLDAQVLHAEALMNTMPWDYWQEDGSPKPATKTVLATLEGVLEKAPNHPMANHLYIHAVEAVHPERGIEAAKRLTGLAPDIGHLVHMPAHIWIRVGDYHKGTETNLRAIEADKRYLEKAGAHGVYPIGYVPHNYHFGWATATLEGRSELALNLARDMAASVDTELMRQRPLTTLQHFWITPLYAQVRFGKWDDILAREEPAEDLIYPRSVWHYARGMAFTRKGEFDKAQAELAALDALRDDPSLKWVTVWDINKSKHILEIASLALGGELAAAQGNYDEAIKLLEEAVASNDRLNYDEPPSWHYPMRHSLGAVLLDAEKPAEAEAVYHRNLEKFPENGWALFGLAEALRAQGKDAKDVEQRFSEAWQYADVELESSRF